MDLKTLISNSFNITSFSKEPFFQALLTGTMTKEQFVKTQNQFYHAVVNFTAPLALVAGAIPTYQERVNIIKNLWEEHGEGDMTNTHGATFTEFLKRLTQTEVEHEAPRRAVTIFNTTLNETSKSAHYLKSVAMIGMIELMFSDISHFIGSAVIERGWMKSEEMIHYSLHRELDVVHAQDFFDILEKQTHPPLNEIQEGLNLGQSVFLNLYQGLFEEACL